MPEFVVIGLGTFGFSVAKRLAEKGYEVLAIDEDEEKVQMVSSLVSQAVQADATDEQALSSLGVQDMDTAVVSIGQNMEASILITLILKELGVKKIIAKALNQLHGTVLRKIGADKVVFPERDMGVKLADTLITPNFFESIELSAQYEIVEISAPKIFIGKTLKALDLRAEYGVDVIAIKKKVPFLTDTGESDFKEEIKIAPNADYEIVEGDILIVLGATNKIERLKKLQ